MKIVIPAALSASLAVAGCTAVPPAATPAYNPADPALGVNDTHHHPVVNYTHREPAGPQGWRRLNDEISPAGTGEQP